MTKRSMERTVGFKSLFLGNMYVCVHAHVLSCSHTVCGIVECTMNHIQNSYCYVNHEKVN